MSLSASAATAPRRLLAIDPGVVNLAYCVLEWDAATPPPSELSLTLAHEALQAGRLRVLDWAVLPLLATGRTGAITAVLAGVVDFLLARADMIRGLGRVVIEQQMKASMKQVAACLYGGLRGLCPGIDVAMQSASLKLAFGDLAAFAPSDGATGAVALTTYSQRKRAAVAVAARLLEAMPPATAATFRASKKKDDLADALLHGLAGCCLVPESGARRRRPVGAAASPQPRPPAKRARCGEASASAAPPPPRVAKAKARGPVTAAQAQAPPRRPLPPTSAPPAHSAESP